MEIISKGKLPEERIWRGECTHCHTIAEAKERELQVTSDQREGEFGSARCPVCSHSMHFYPKK